MRKLITFVILLTIKVAARPFYRYDYRWIAPPATPWGDYRVIAFLNHTSLFEWLFAGGVPVKFLWRIASHGLVPLADVTSQRPVIGRFFRILCPHVITVTRERDHTWKAVLERAGEDVMVIILPEGRMKRANGLDKHGLPMTVRGGIADILHAIPGGTMLIAYSAGLHHVQVPGQLLPKPFKTLRMGFEEADIAQYKSRIGALEDPRTFKQLVKDDLQRRRDLHCC